LHHYFHLQWGISVQSNNIKSTNLLAQNSKFPLIQHTQDPIDARISKLLNNQMVPILMEVPMGNFLSMPLYLDCTTIQGSIPFGYLLHLLVKGHNHPLL
jgi:hypothetical protein